MNKNKLVSNLEECYKSRKEVLNIFRDYTKTLFEAKYKAKYGAGLKIFKGYYMIPLYIIKWFKDYE